MGVAKRGGTSARAWPEAEWAWPHTSAGVATGGRERLGVAAGLSVLGPRERVGVAGTPRPTPPHHVTRRVVLLPAWAA